MEARRLDEGNGNLRSGGESSRMRRSQTGSLPPSFTKQMMLRESYMLTYRGWVMMLVHVGVRKGFGQGHVARGHVILIQNGGKTFIPKFT